MSKDHEELEELERMLSGEDEKKKPVFVPDPEPLKESVHTESYEEIKSEVAAKRETEDEDNIENTKIDVTMKSIASPIKANKSTGDGALELFNPLEGVSNINDIVSFSDLDMGLQEQPALYAFYAECASRAQLQLNRAKQNLEMVSSRVMHKLKARMAAKGEKITDKQLEANMRITTVYNNAFNCVNDAQYIYKMCQTVVEALSQREQMLIQSCKRAEKEIRTKPGFTGAGGREARDEILKKAMK